MQTYRCVNERNAGPEVRIRLDFVYEGVLAPIPGHQRNAHEGKWDQEDEDGSLRVNKSVHGVQEDVIGDFATASFERKAGLVVAKEVAWQIKPH